MVYIIIIIISIKDYIFLISAVYHSFHPDIKYFICDF